jgi:hypothetical protein
MPVKMKEDEDKDDAHSHNDLDSVRKIEMEDEHHAHFQNERDSVRNLAIRAEQRCLTFTQFVDIMPTIVEEDEDDAQSIMDSVRTVEKEDEHPSHFHNEGDSVMRMKMEDECAPHCQNEVDSVMINKQRLPLTLTEETVVHQVSKDSSVKMGRCRENCIEASRVTSEKEKKDPMNKKGVCLAPPPNLKARGAKVVSQSSPCHRPSGMGCEDI